MTSETQQTEPATTETETEPNNLRNLIEGARVVLWDFDGPVCRLFAGHSAERVARDLVEWLEGQGLHGLLAESERESLDPQELLRAVDARHAGSDLVTEFEQRLTREEKKAAISAWPTQYADPLVRTWTAVGARLAITTNNSPCAVREYLTSRELLQCFAPHIYGRTQNLQHLKPHPHCINRALTALGAAPSTALMIGDAPSDLHAARAAGVSFLGYARNERKSKLLRDAGAQVIVSSLQPVLEAVREAGRA